MKKSNGKNGRLCPVTKNPCYYGSCTEQPCLIKTPQPLKWKPSAGPNPGPAITTKAVGAAAAAKKRKAKS